jgi:LysR family transcriptional regulator, hydrogen peroxide-inducible genes activator
MNLSHLRFVQSVAELASFSRAAEKCHVTQASLSNAVSQLEDQLGGRIFSRTTRKVGVTPFGERILPMIASVLSAADELTKGAQEYLNPSYRIIRLGLTPLIDTRIVAAVLAPFRRLQPHVDIIFKECHLNDLRQRLLEGTLDFAFQPCGPSDKRIGRLTFHAEQLLYLSRNPSPHQVSGSGPVRLEQIASESFALSVGCGLADSTREIFRQHRLKLQEYPGQALSYKVMEDWADLGVAAAILPESKVSPACRAARLLYDSNGPLSIRYEMIWNRRLVRPKHVREFLSYFNTTAKGIVGGLARARAAS